MVFPLDTCNMELFLGLLFFQSLNSVHHFEMFSMATAEEIRDAAYELLLSRTGGYYDIQELEDDLR